MIANQYNNRFFTDSLQNPLIPKIEEPNPTNIGSRISKAASGVIETLTATNVLLGVCLAAHAAAIVYPSIRKHGSFYLPNILKGEIWRLATSLVLHNGFLHLLSNMHALYEEGPKIEKNWGARGFAQITAMATATEVIAASIVSPNMNAIGLSGVLFGMQGALVARSLKGNRKDISDVFRKTGSFIFKEYMITQIMRNVLGMNISFVSHVSGFIGGMLFGWLSTSSPALQTDESLKVGKEKSDHNTARAF